ncbi:MAG TPA: hypothetical protein VMV86_00865 [Methanosarcinales archaeon]|nr:hypothetical protein [Methanosarcinales archaeon]
MIKQLGVAYKTTTATLTYAELGDVVVNSATAVTITLPAPNNGLWYRISNVGVGLVTIYYGATITTLKQNEQALLLANGTATWWMSKGREAMTKAEIEAVLTGNITSHTHDFTGLSDVPANYTGAGSKFVKVKADATGLEFVEGEAIASAFTDLTDAPGSYVGNAEKIVAVNITEDALEFIDAPTGGGLVINPNHIFVDTTARDDYFTANPTELVTGIYISVGAGFQQWDGAVWLDKTAVVTGPIGPTGLTGAGVPVGGTAGQVLSKIDATDNNTEWVTPGGGGLVNTTYGLQFAASTTEEGVDQNAVTGSSYISISSNTVGVIIAMRLIEVKVDLKAGTYNLWIDRVDQGQIILADDTADAVFSLATPVVLAAGVHRFEIVRTAAAIWYYKNVAYSGTIWNESDMIFGTNPPGAYAIPMKLIAYLGTWEIVS